VPPGGRAAAIGCIAEAEQSAPVSTAAHVAEPVRRSTRTRQRGPLGETKAISESEARYIETSPEEASPVISVNSEEDSELSVVTVDAGNVPSSRSLRASRWAAEIRAAVPTPDVVERTVEKTTTVSDTTILRTRSVTATSRKVKARR
jgi:hypothetical protein